MRELREHNENMLRNILPSHVARHFLEKDRDNEVKRQNEWVSRSFSLTGKAWHLDSKNMWGGEDESLTLSLSLFFIVLYWHDS